MHGRDERDMATEGAKDRLKGMVKEGEGRLRDAAGGLTGNTKEQLKGKAQQAKGKIQQGIGKVKQQLDPNAGVDDV